MLALPADLFVKYLLSDGKFAEWFYNLPQPQESYLVASKAVDLYAKRFQGWHQKIKTVSGFSSVTTMPSASLFTLPPNAPPDYEWYLSTDGVPGRPVGSLMAPNSKLPEFETFRLPLRIVGFPSLTKYIGSNLPLDSSPSDDIQKLESIGSVSLEQLGIVEYESVDELSKYPAIKGKGVLFSDGCMRNDCFINNVPFRRDAIKKFLRNSLDATKAYPLSF